MYELNSNVFFVSSRTTTDSDISNEQEIYNYITNYNDYHVQYYFVKGFAILFTLDLL